MRRLLVVILALVPLASFADDGLPRAERERPAAAHHFVLTAEHTLRMNERAELAAEGVEIQQVLPGRRYIIRATDAEAVADDPRVASIEPLALDKKIDRSAYREAALAKPLARVYVIFHSDVSFADAQSAIQNIGGIVDQQPLGESYILPGRVSARIPFGSLTDLASDDRVLAVYGPTRKPRPMNAVAAQVSHVTPLFSAPYNLSGAGVVVSEFEFARADAEHPQFATGRLIPHVTGTDADSALHATHVAGTIIANGIDPANPLASNAKGMAPAATLHEYDANENYPDVMLQTKQTQLPTVGSVADNNSWGFPLSWQLTADGWVWEGGEELYGAYDSQYTTPYDALAKTSPVLFVQSSGNDGASGDPILPSPWSNHEHTDENGNTIANETFCYSQDGTGKDCPVPCTQTPGHCETTKHPTHNAFTTVGPTATLKNVLAIGATNPDGASIARFSSRGPTLDGRVKPDLVAKGVSQYSTAPGNGYQIEQGTSMSAPVITGISALLVEQYRKTFAGQNPLPIVLKTLLIAGATDVGNPGPDYTFGWGLANAQASVDLMIADNNTGSRIRVANISQGQTVETPLTLSSAQNLRVVVGWIDPEVLLSGTDALAKTLVNDLDLKVVDPSGNTVLPYVLDKNNPNNPATHGVNSVDNTEEVEIANAAPGTYRVLLNGTNVATGPYQQYVLIANAALGPTVVPCTDPFEPNDTPQTAFGNLVTGSTITASTCSSSDVDFYKFQATKSGPVTVTVRTTDTPLHVEVKDPGCYVVTCPSNSIGGSTDIPLNSTGTIAFNTTGGPYDISISPTGAIGPQHTYTLTTTYPRASVARHRATRH